MFEDMGTLCLLGVFVIVGLMLASRMFGGRAGTGGYRGEPTDFGERGPERRTIDNPEVESRGSFGRPRRSFLPRRSGGDRSSGGGFFRGSSRGSSGRIDNSEVSSRGSFGRSKK